MLIENQINGTRRAYAVEEWLTNSLHFPLANIILEMLITGVPAYLGEIGLYALLTGSAIQAWFLGAWRFEGNPRPLVGNLIGPAFYTVIEVAAEGMVFFNDPYHWAYWFFSLAIGALQQGRLAVRDETVLVLAENVVRTCILLATYWMLEVIDDARFASLEGFFGDRVHQFLTIVLVLLGLALGFANATSGRYLLTLRRTAAKLKRYSSWLLGEEMLARAVEDPAELLLRRRERAVLFLDIRGFTAWSEARSPEEVVSMLNHCFELGETTWANRSPIKAKYTGDEIMLIFSKASDAYAVAGELHRTLGGFLAGHRLACGIGLHYGPLVEGLLGSHEVKGYDVIGDTVNTAKRICDQAEGGRMLVSEPFVAALGKKPLVRPMLLRLKGKTHLFPVYRIPK